MSQHNERPGDDIERQESEASSRGASRPSRSAPPGGRKKTPTEELVEELLEEDKGEGFLEQALEKKLAPWAGSIPDDDAFRLSFPHVWRFMTELILQERWQRTPPTMTISLDGSVWKVVVRDNSLAQACGAACLTFDGLMRALNEAMKAPHNWSTIRTRSKKLKDIRGKE